MSLVHPHSRAYQITVSLVVSNFSVLLPIFYRKFATGDSDSETEELSTGVLITTWVPQTGTDTYMSAGDFIDTDSHRESKSADESSSRFSEEVDGKRKSRNMLDTESREDAETQ